MDLLSLTATPLLAYLLIALLVALDSVIPALPAETAVISAGALAGAGHFHPVPLTVTAVIGAILGDHLAYGIGRKALRRPLDRALGGRAGQRIRAWATRRLAKHGTITLVAARFIPGGRTATTTVAGWLRFPQLAFLIAVSIGGIAWSIYSVGIGYAAGAALPGPLWQRVAIGVGVGLLISAWAGAIQKIIGVRRRLARRSAAASEPAPSRASRQAAQPPVPASATRGLPSAESSR